MSPNIMKWGFALPANTRAHNVFHVSLLKIYVHDLNHVIDWDVIQVEPERELQTEILCILDKKVTLLQNPTIRQVRVQWKHFGLDEVTWELEDAMKEAHIFFFF